MSTLNLPQSRIPMGWVMIQGQRVPVEVDQEWARYFFTLTDRAGGVIAPNNLYQTITQLPQSSVVLSGVDDGEPGDIGPPGRNGQDGAPGLSIRGMDGEDGEPGVFMLQPPPIAEAFIAPTLLNSWVNYGAPYNSVGYYKDPFGIVHLRGLVKSGTIGLDIFTLPAGYRPAASENLACVSNGAFGQCVVAAAGGITPAAGSNLSFSLDGITFRAA